MLKCNTQNHLTMCKQMINIELNYEGKIAIIEMVLLCANK